MLLNILLVILVLDCVALVAVILLQQSEGGALGMGGGPTGMFTARGAGDLLTTTTQILAGVFFVLALLITLLGSYNQRTNSVVRGLKLDSNAPVTAPRPAGQPGPANSSAPPLPGAPAPNAAPPLPGAPAPNAAPPLPGAPAPSAAAPLPGAPAPAQTAAAPRPARVHRTPAAAPAATTPAPQPQPTAPAASTPAASQ